MPHNSEKLAIRLQISSSESALRPAIECPRKVSLKTKKREPFWLALGHSICSNLLGQFAVALVIAVPQSAEDRLVNIEKNASHPYWFTQT